VAKKKSVARGSNPDSSGLGASVDRTDEKTPAKEIPASPAWKAPRASLHRMAIDSIVVPAGQNPREAFNEGTLFELGESIKVLGLLQPIVCRELRGAAGKAELVFGERRLRACKQAGQEFVDVMLYPFDSLPDQIAADMRLAENFQRDNLNHMEIAGAFGRSRDAGRSIQQISQQVHRSDDFVRKHLDLLRLAEPIRKLVASGRLPIKQAELISRVGDQEHQLDLAGTVVGTSWDERKKCFADPYGSVGDAVDGITSDFVLPCDRVRAALVWHMKKLGACGWPMDGDYAGKRACAGCPDNTATEPALFEGVNLPGSSKKGNCTNPACFEAKWKAWQRDPIKKKRDEQRAKSKADSAAAAGKGGAGTKPPPAAGKPKGTPPGIIAEQKFCAAVAVYGRNVANAIGKWIAGGEEWTDRRLEVIADVLAVIRTEAVLYDVQIGKHRLEAADLARQFKRGKTQELPTAFLAELFFAAVDCVEEAGADVLEGDSGRGNEAGDLLTCLVAFAGKWAIDVPKEPPTLNYFTLQPIVDGKRDEAEPAVAACEDLKLLRTAMRAGLMAPWRKAAVQKRIQDLEAAGKKAKATRPARKGGK